MKPKIITKGFLISIYAIMPGYEAVFDISSMSWTTLRSFLQELGEAVRERDAEWRERRSRGRSIKIFYKRVRDPLTKKTREIKYLKLITVPSRVLSILSLIKQGIYMDLIPTYCEKLFLVATKGRRKVLYFLPAYNLEPFLQELKTYDEDIKEANQIINEYKNSKHLKTIQAILKKYGYEPELEIPKVPKIRYDLAPLIFDPDLVKQWIENKELVQEIEAKIKEKQKQIINKAVRKLRIEVNAVIETIRAEKFKPEAAEKALKRIEAIAESVGLESIVAPTVSQLRQALENPPILDPKIAQQLDQRIKSLLENL